MNKNNFYEDYKKLQKHLHSDENKLICQPYVKECQRLAELANQYSGKCQLLYENLSSTIINYEYSSGGEILHRGYYCPSPILDIVVGNGNRGKLLKRLTTKSKPTYKYGFNGQNELVVVSTSHLDESEIIISHGETETSIMFSEDYGINVLSECIYYNQQIASYVFCIYDSSQHRVVNYKKEDYTYSTKGLETADIFRLLNDEKEPILQHEKYTFAHDNDGYLSNYTVAEYDGNSIKQSVWDGHVFDVKIRRKV